MIAKQNLSVRRKESGMTRRGVITPTQQAELVLQNTKKNTGTVIHVAIDDRTTIELPAHMPQEEIDARVKKHIELRNSRK